MTGFRSATHVVQLATLVLAALGAVQAQAQAPAPTRFTVSADGQEVLDTKTSLLWRRCPEGMLWDGKLCKGKPTKFKFAGAKDYTAKLAKTANKSWRLPTKEELQGIVVKQKKKPMLDQSAFPNTPSATFWAVREGFSDNLNAWMVNFGNGRVYGNNGEAKPHLRLVRANS